jgi:hypothetical protein
VTPWVRAEVAAAEVAEEEVAEEEEVAAVGAGTQTLQIRF